MDPVAPLFLWDSLNRRELGRVKGYSFIIIKQRTEIFKSVLFIILGRAHDRYGPCCSPFSVGFIDAGDERRPVNCTHFSQVNKI